MAARRVLIAEILRVLNDPIMDIQADLRPESLVASDPRSFYLLWALVSHAYHAERDHGVTESNASLPVLLNLCFPCDDDLVRIVNSLPTLHAIRRLD